MHDSPEQNLVGDHAVEPDILVCRKRPGQLGPNNTNDVAQHWDEDEATIECKDETCAARRPNGPFESV